MTGELPDKPLRTLGERLKWWREKRGYKTPKALARACGLGVVSPTAISGLEYGRQKSSTRLVTIAAALKINAHYLETGEGDPLDLKALPAPRPVSNILVALVEPEDIADLTENELEIVRYRLRDAIQEVLNRRPSRRKQDKRA